MKFLIISTIFFCSFSGSSQLILLQHGPCGYHEDSCTRQINKKYGIVKVDAGEGCCVSKKSWRHNNLVYFLLWFRNGPNWQKRYQKKLDLGCDLSYINKSKLILYKFCNMRGTWIPRVSNCERRINEKYSFKIVYVDHIYQDKYKKKNIITEQNLLGINGDKWRANYNKDIKEFCS